MFYEGSNMGYTRLEKDLITNHRRAMGERLIQLREQYSRQHGEKCNQEKFGRDILKIDDLYESHSTDPDAETAPLSGAAIKKLMNAWEGGHKDVPPIVLQRYSLACGVSIDSIINGEEFKPSPANVTLKDLCKQIELLDLCGMIKTEIDKDGKTRIEFCAPDTTFGNGYLLALGDYVCDAPRDYLIALRRFIEQYKIVKQINSIPGSADVARDAMETLYRNIPERSEEICADGVELSAQAILDTINDLDWYALHKHVDADARDMM